MNKSQMYKCYLVDSTRYWCKNNVVDIPLIHTDYDQWKKKLIHTKFYVITFQYFIYTRYSVCNWSSTEVYLESPCIFQRSTKMIIVHIDSSEVACSITHYI